MPVLTQPMSGALMPVSVQSLVQPVDWSAIAAPLTVALTAVVVLLVDAFVGDGYRHRRALAMTVSVLGLAVALGWLVQLRGQTRRTFCAVGELLPGYGCSFVVDDVALVFGLVIVAGALLVVLLPAGFPGRGDRSAPPGEFHFLLLASVTGAVTVTGARDLITLVVAVELLSLPGFALVGLRRYADPQAAEAAVKFFLVSVVSVAVMLFGISLVYGATGHVHYEQVAAGLSESAGAGHGDVAAAGAVLTLVGLAFKVGAVPFHVWIPDTYLGAPVPVAAYLAVVSKAAGFAGLIGVLHHAFGPYASVWGPVVAVLAVLTMTVGNLAALRQRHVVRLLAWSSVAQAGYMLVPLGAAGALDGDHDRLLTATVVYVAIYVAMNLGAFAVVAGRGLVWLDECRGLVRTDPASAVPLGFFLVCLAGLPPGVAGLFAKVVVLRAAVEGGVGWLAVTAAVNIVIGLAYYLYWTAQLFLPAASTSDEPGAERAGVADNGGSARPTTRSLPADIVVGVTLGVTVIVSVLPGVVLAALELTL